MLYPVNGSEYNRMLKVIGIGNRLMMDDGIALVVLDHLKDKLNFEEIEVILGETDYQTCFYQISESDIVIIIDALSSGGNVGTIRICKLQEAISVFGSYESQHDMSIFNLMQLYPRQYQGYFIGIEIAELGYADALSEKMLEKFDSISKEIESRIFEIVKNHTSNLYLY